VKGRGIGKFVKGERLLNFNGIAAGDLIACYSRQFDALNLIKVVGLRTLPSGHRLADWRYADGDDSGRVHGAPDWIQGSVWECDIDDSDRVLCHYEWYRAVAPRKGKIRTTIRSYQDLLDFFEAPNASDLHVAIEERLGVRTKIYMHGENQSEYYLLPGPLPHEPPREFRMESFTVSISKDGG
jgi:hypothetical protein